MNEGRRREFERLLAQAPRRRVTRRDLLRRAGLSAGALSAGAFLSACGISGEAERNQGEADPLTTTKQQGELDFANWPAYIDKAQGDSPTLQQFEKETGIEVNYEEAINDNVSFYATIREPLANDQSTGWDLIVVTEWLITNMARLGYLEQLDHSRIGNFREHADDVHVNPPYDPDNAHSIPWQSGITGIAYNPEITGREITSVEELFNPEFAGKVGMFTEMRDTMSLVLVGMGVDPGEATVDDAKAAQQKLLEQLDAGIVRQYYGNNYVGPLANGDLALCIAWSGDVIGKTLGASSPIEFVVPDEGGILWTDCMSIPQDAEHPIDAMEMMNFVYQPDIAAQMTAWINYITPVPEAQAILAKSEDAYTRKVASSPLAFPSPEILSNIFHYKDLDPKEEEIWNDLFNEVLQG
jgi:spermidine/putrescine transport system substrate-binding protein